MAVFFLRSLLPLLGTVCMAGTPMPVDSACKYALDANAKIYSIPVHIYSTETAAFTGGKPRSNELIYLNNKTYIQVAGKWRLSPKSTSEMRDVRKEAQAAEQQNLTCRVVRDEAVNGEAASVYSMHQKTDDATIDSQVWISKSRGIPLKTESDTDLGGAAGKTHRSLRYEYTNVQAPAIP